jgi:hypothetical protein
VIPDLVSLALSNIGNGLPEKAALLETAARRLKTSHNHAHLPSRNLVHGNLA